MRRRTWIILLTVLCFFSGCASPPNTPQIVKESTTKTDDPNQFPEHNQVPGNRSTVNANKQPEKVVSFIPNHLEIPVINVNTRVEPVGILSNGQMGVPDSFETVGILTPWTKPGEKGNAVIAGHFDHYTGPAIFYNLRKLKPGDRIVVSNKEGIKLIFVVKKVESFKTGDAPLQEIFGKSEKSHLNLITCSGKFNKQKREHARRLVVFSELSNEINDRH